MNFLRLPSFIACAMCCITVVMLAGCRKERKTDSGPAVQPRETTIVYSGQLNADRPISFSPSHHMAHPFWDFGDGTTLATVDGSIVSHTYSATGTYTVSVRSSDSTIFGRREVTIREPFHSFRYRGKHTAGDTIWFQPDQLLAGNSVMWSFGDGTTSADPAPYHIFNSAGRYTVQLSVNGGAVTDGSVVVRIFNLSDTATRVIAERKFRLTRKHERFLNSPGDPGTNFLLPDGSPGLSVFTGQQSLRLGDRYFKYTPARSGSGIYYFTEQQTASDLTGYIIYDVVQDSVSLMFASEGYSELYGKAPMAFEYFYNAVQR